MLTRKNVFQDDYQVMYMMYFVILSQLDKSNTTQSNEITRPFLNFLGTKRHIYY